MNTVFVTFVILCYIVVSCHLLECPDHTNKMILGS
jgi:hypothetical protein